MKIGFLFTKVMDILCLKSIYEQCVKNKSMNTAVYIYSPLENGITNIEIVEKLDEFRWPYRNLDKANATLSTNLLTFCSEIAVQKNLNSSLRRHLWRCCKATSAVIGDNMDIVFAGNPYIQDIYTLLYYSGIKLVYIPYASSISGEKYSLQLQYQLTIHKLAWKIYILDKFYEKFYITDEHRASNIVVINSTPKFDNVLHEVPRQNSIINAKVFLWNIHHSTAMLSENYQDGGDRKWSSFFIYKNILYNIFLQHTDLQLIIRPHPNFYTNKYSFFLYEFDEFSNLNNVHIDNSAKNTFITSFQKADVLITDLSSMMLDFLITGKPIISLFNDKSCFLNEFAEGLFKTYTYQVHDESCLENVIKDLAAGNDPLFSERRKLVQGEGPFNLSKTAAELIIEDILSTC